MRSGTEFSAGGVAPANLGQVEFRLARDALIREYHRGRLSRIDICDAQPELIRVATHLGIPTEIDCPICEETKLVHVSFAFGPTLPASGRALSSMEELRQISRRQKDIACYLVEVCTNCNWNHLVRLFNPEHLRRRPLATRH